MAGWLETSGVLPKFDVCIGKGLDTPGGEFYEASEALISVFDLISGMSMASGDMRKNAVTIQKLSAGGTTLKALVEAECAGKSEKELKKIAGDGATASCALLWLARALNFVIKLLDVMIEDKTKKLSDCVMAGYEVSLKPHHGFMVKGTFTVAVKAAPSREAFIAKLGPSEEKVFADIGAKLPAMKSLISSIQDFLVSKDAKHFAP